MWLTASLNLAEVGSEAQFHIVYSLCSYTESLQRRRLQQRKQSNYQPENKSLAKLSWLYVRQVKTEKKFRSVRESGRYQQMVTENLMKTETDRHPPPPPPLPHPLPIDIYIKLFNVNIILSTKHISTAKGTHSKQENTQAAREHRQHSTHTVKGYRQLHSTHTVKGYRQLHSTHTVKGYRQLHSTHTVKGYRQLHSTHTDSKSITDTVTQYTYRL